MFILIFLFAFTFTTYIFFGTYILLINPRKGINRLFFINMLLLAAMCIISILIQSAPDQNFIWIIEKIYNCIAILFYALMLFFLLKLSQLITLQKKHYVLISIPVAANFIYSLISPPMFYYNKINGI